jgi:hypothetical protein
MSFFNPQAPILRRKQTHLDIQDLEGLIFWQWKIKEIPIFSLLYTRIDQVFLLWGWIVGAIFLTPQLLPAWGWTHQALLGTILSLVGIGGMAGFARFWVKVEQLTWLIYLWGVLVILGLGLTNYGIFMGIGSILMNLCPLWLSLCGCGYVVMGLGMRSRTFLTVGILHFGSIPVLQVVPSYQFLTTALIMSGTLFTLAEVQWDMRPPVVSPILSREQIAFNQKQERLRNKNFPQR